MKRRVLALLLALSLMNVPSLAAEQTGTAPGRIRTYADQFSDVAADSTFRDNVAALYEYGLTVGKTDGTFGPGDSVTVGQTIIFASRLRSLWDSGDPESGAAAFSDKKDAVCGPYLAHLRALGVLEGELGTQYDVAATRAQVAHVLARALPDGSLPEINGTLTDMADASRSLLPDVADDLLWRDDILRLYKWGVCQGGTDGAFQPARPITRGALSAMLTRMLDPTLRVTPDWDMTAAFHAAGTAWSDLGTTAAYIAAPYTDAEIRQDIAYMLTAASNRLELRYGAQLSVPQVRQIMDTALAAVKESCEQCYNAVSCSYGSGGSVTLTFTAAARTAEETAAYRDYALSAAIAVHDALWDSGQLTWDMNDYQKARVYYDWVCSNCVYDSDAGDQSLSHIAYALFHDGIAVCDGYTGAYNLLLKLEGIPCLALSNTEHIWTVAELDGVSCHIDTTWGDSSGRGTDYTYFAMTPARSWSCHPW